MRRTNSVTALPPALRGLVLAVGGEPAAAAEQLQGLVERQGQVLRGHDVVEETLGAAEGSLQFNARYDPLAQLVVAAPQQVLDALYSLPASDFHDITSGSNGLPSLPGYDLVTGLGSWTGQTP